MKTGIFGGSFNPLHNGHLHLMNSFKQSLGLDRIILIPTAVPPHKSGGALASKEDRINMLRLIENRFEHIEISDIEFKREGKSYTFDTICELKKMYNDDEFFLLIGSDQYLAFMTWYRAQEILKLVTVCSSARERGVRSAMLDYKAEHACMKNTVVEDFEALEISSSQVREHVKNKKSIKDLVPKEVEQYIKEHGLYV